MIVFAGAGEALERLVAALPVWRKWALEPEEIAALEDAENAAEDLRAGLGESGRDTRPRREQ